MLERVPVCVSSCQGRGAAHWKRELTSGSSCERGCPTSGASTATIALGACSQASELQLGACFRQPTLAVASTKRTACTRLVGLGDGALQDGEERQRHHDQQRHLRAAQSVAASAQALYVVCKAAAARFTSCLTCRAQKKVAVCMRVPAAC